MASLPAGEDELFEIAGDCEPGPGTEWTCQAAEPMAPARRQEEAPADRATAAPTAGNPLRNAVRLTRDALFAWINLLQSPALVTVPQ
jgi:hypothetical protein